MTDDRDPRLARKNFLASTALAASAAALAACRPTGAARDRKLGNIVYPILTPAQYDHAGMMAKLRVSTPHKQLFPATGALVQPQTDIAVIYLHMQFALNGFQFSLPESPRKLATLGVFSGSAIFFGLNDDMWREYEVGKRFGLAQTNVYYHASSKLDLAAAPSDPKGIYQDWSAQAVLKRGGSLMLCHNAMTYFATDCAMRRERKPQSVMDEWLANLLPGFLVVPSGIIAMQLAAENGWEIYPAG